MLVSIPFFSDVLKGDGKIKILKSHELSDLVDRLHHVITPWILIFYMFIVGSKMQFGSPITCLIDQELTAWSAYYHEYCFISGKYRYLNGTHIPSGHEMRSMLRQKMNLDVNYYQWVPFFLLFQVACFALPNLFWKNWNWEKLSEFRFLIANSKQLMSTVKLEEYKEKVESTAKYISSYIQLGEKMSIRRGFYGHHSVFVRYLGYKLIHLFNTCIQIYCVAKFLGMSTIGTVHEQLGYIFEWDSNNQMGLGLFPRTVLCDTSQVGLINKHNHTFQCLLPINYLNEKIFLIHFIWLWILLIISVINFINWFMVVIRPLTDDSDLAKLIYSGDVDIPRSFSRRAKLLGFFNEFLGLDGCFLFRQIQVKTGNVNTMEIMIAVWKIYCSTNHIDKPIEIPMKKESNGQMNVNMFGGGDSLNDNVPLMHKGNI